MVSKEPEQPASQRDGNVVIENANELQAFLPYRRSIGHIVAGSLLAMISA